MLHNEAGSYAVEQTALSMAEIGPKPAAFGILTHHVHQPVEMLARTRLEALLIAHQDIRARADGVRYGTLTGNQDYIVDIVGQGSDEQVAQVVDRPVTSV